jgi:hypothetical protein
MHFWVCLLVLLVALPWPDSPQVLSAELDASGSTPGHPSPPPDILPQLREMMAKASVQAELPGQCQNFGTNGSGPFYKGTGPMKVTAQGMPGDFREYVRENRFGYIHDKWHSEHTWDFRLKHLGNLIRWNCNKFRRFARQMGDVGSGLDFLAIHRAMVQDVRRKFPEYADTLLAGWLRVPTDPNDRANRLPGDAKTQFNQQILAKINRVQDNLGSFSLEDELGLFIWSDLSKVPFRSEVTSLHFYLHLRWTAPNDTQTNLARETQNLESKYFWKLHGRIDRIWDDYRRMKGWRDNDPSCEALLQASHTEMFHH